MVGKHTPEHVQVLRLETEEYIGFQEQPEEVCYKRWKEWRKVSWNDAGTSRITKGPASRVQVREVERIKNKGKH